MTSACHHCLDPACLNACPVDAYEKDPVTGIVKHLDDQCFGCQYCTLACPYDVPKFHAGKGIVRKCDMCSDRLSGGRGPGVRPGLPARGDRITVVDRDEVVPAPRRGDFLPGAFDPSYTIADDRLPLAPAGRRPSAGRRIPVEPEHAHLPLVVMLVLTQLSVGGFLVELAVSGWPGSAGASARPLHLGCVSGWAMSGLAASVLHLGRPLFAYRAILGLRHSWLSREVLAFGLFAELATLFVAARGPRRRAGSRVGRVAGRPCWRRWSCRALAGVGSSVMVYHVVRRPFWQAPCGGVKFAGTPSCWGWPRPWRALGISTGRALRRRDRSRRRPARGRRGRR